MSEKTDALKLAERLLDEPNADPDDDLRMLSRQFLRKTEVVNRLEKRLAEMQDPTLDMIRSNIETDLRMCQEAIRRVKNLLSRHGDVPDVTMCLRVIDALNAFHPMHGESWRGWPEGSI